MTNECNPSLLRNPIAQYYAAYDSNTGSMKFKVLIILLRSGTEHIARTRSIARGPSLRNVTDGGYKVWVSVESVFSVFEVGLQEDNKDALTPYIYLHKWMERPQMQWSN